MDRKKLMNSTRLSRPWPVLDYTIMNKLALQLVLFFCTANALGAQCLNRIPFKANQDWGYKSINHRVIILPQYDYAFPFDRNGIAKVRAGGKVRFINTSGKIMVNDNVRYHKEEQFFESIRQDSVAWYDLEGSLMVKVPKEEYESRIPSVKAFVCKSPGGKMGVREVVENGGTKLVVDTAYKSIYKSEEYIYCLQELYTGEEIRNVYGLDYNIYRIDTLRPKMSKDLVQFTDNGARFNSGNKELTEIIFKNDTVFIASKGFCDEKIKQISIDAEVSSKIKASILNAWSLRIKGKEMVRECDNMVVVDKGESLNLYRLDGSMVQEGVHGVLQRVLQSEEYVFLLIEMEDSRQKIVILDRGSKEIIKEFEDSRLLDILYINTSRKKKQLFMSFRTDPDFIQLYNVDQDRLVGKYKAIKRTDRSNFFVHQKYGSNQFAFQTDLKKKEVAFTLPLNHEIQYFCENKTVVIARIYYPDPITSEILYSSYIDSNGKEYNQ